VVLRKDLGAGASFDGAGVESYPLLQRALEQLLRAGHGHGPTCQPLLIGGVEVQEIQGLISG
jgi:hypothetical protein